MNLEINIPSALYSAINAEASRAGIPVEGLILQQLQKDFIVKNANAFSDNNQKFESLRKWQTSSHEETSGLKEAVREFRDHFSSGQYLE